MDELAVLKRKLDLKEQYAFLLLQIIDELREQIAKKEENNDG